jgi:oligoribonuclease NrnB/cAMP/cGMP phosphodiesterase (DHH superfamily)
MDNMEQNKFEDVINFVKNIKEKSNTEITQTLDKLNEDFNYTKVIIIDLTHDLDKIEELYTTILNEYNKRQNG